MVAVIRSGLLLALLSACGARPHLPSVTEEYRRVDNTLTFELPDTGGYLVNSIPLDTARLAQLYHSVFDERLPNLRAAFVLDNPRRPWSDVEFLLVVVVQVARHLIVKPAMDTQGGLVDLRIVGGAADFAFGRVVESGVFEHDSLHNDSVFGKRCPGTLARIIP